MSKTPVDSTDVARKALTGIDAGWYDTYWYGPPADTRRLRLRRVIRRLTSTMTAALARPRGWPVANSLAISRKSGKSVPHEYAAERDDAGTAIIGTVVLDPTKATTTI